MALITKIGNIELNGCIMNAAGILTSHLQLQNLQNSCAGAIVTKTCTLMDKKGHTSPTRWKIPYGMINSVGLRNPGLQYYLDLLDTIKKPVIISITFKNKQELKKMLLALQKAKETHPSLLVEINVSCPNVTGMPTLTPFLLEKIEKWYPFPYGFKLPLYFKENDFMDISNILNSYLFEGRGPHFIVCGNTLPGLAIDLDIESPLIYPNGGIGGISGLYLKPFALLNVYKFRQLLRPCIDIIACGGAATGRDVFEFILCGASAVQIGNHLINNPQAIDHLSNELYKIMKEKGYISINEFKGKLKKKAAL